MLVNIYSYARPHAENPRPKWEAWRNTTGVWPAKSMPYVAEVATRARSGMFLLSSSDRNNMSNFFTNNVVGEVTNWSANNTTNLMGSDGKTRQSFWYLTNALVDLAFGFVNPNPFATNTNVTTLTVVPEGGNFWHGQIAGNSDLPDAVSPATPVDTLNGVYALRPLPVFPNGPFFGLRANGTNCYFNLGAVPDNILTNTNYGTALQIKGWMLSDTNGITFDQVPMAHLAQKSPVRSWWQMAAVTNGVFNNAGPIYHMTSLAWFRTGGMSTNSTGSYPTFSSLVNRSVGWFTPKTICAFTNNFSTNPVFPVVHLSASRHELRDGKRVNHGQYSRQ